MPSSVLSLPATLSFIPERTGSVDPAFEPPEPTDAASVTLRNLILTPKGGVFAARAITMRDGATRQEIVEFDSKGAELRRMVFGEFDSFKRGVDGSLLILGALGDANRRLMRFDPRGTLDGGFAPTFNAKHQSGYIYMMLFTTFVPFV